jgi:endonuclease YncB( thermonuclease family)
MRSATKQLRPIAIAVAMSFLFGGDASAQVTGLATVLSSDNISINGQTFRLYGIDAIDFHQYCYVDGEPWACGASATRALQVLLEPFPVTCDPRPERDGDARFAVCTTAEGDVAEIMIRRGWAVAYRAQSDDYVAAETEARAAGEGAWRGTFAEPWVYREEMAAIEQHYLERTMAELPQQAAFALVNELGGIGVFDAFEITAGTATATVEHELTTDWLPPGFILATIEERGVFDWLQPAVALAEWRREFVTRVQTDAVASVWAGLSERAVDVVDVADPESYYAAMIQGASVWIGQGRQPVLMVAARGVPEWVTDWFSGNPPAGAAVSQKEEMSAGYLGTIDGVDVFFGEAPDAESYLFPSDLLIAVTYSAGATGQTIEFATDATALSVTIRYRQSLQWRDDPIVSLRYPYDPPPDNPYGS